MPKHIIEKLANNKTLTLIVKIGISGGVIIVCGGAGASIGSAVPVIGTGIGVGIGVTVGAAVAAVICSDIDNAIKKYHKQHDNLNTIELQEFNHNQNSMDENHTAHISIATGKNILNNTMGNNTISDLNAERKTTVNWQFANKANIFAKDLVTNSTETKPSI